MIEQRGEGGAIRSGRSSEWKRIPPLAARERGEEEGSVPKEA